MALPPKVGIEFVDSVRTYWFARVTQHMHDSYAGIPLLKFPEDLRVYEHLLWESRANVVIELGAHAGGSALWFRDRLSGFHAYGRIGSPRVISVDVNIATAREAIGSVDPVADDLVLLEGDVRDPDLPALVERHLAAGARCLVVEDTAHRYETTRAALEGFARFVPRGGYFVVEDGCVDVEEMRVDSAWPRGVLPALNDWLQSVDGEGFVVRRELELYGLTSHPHGFLERVG